MKTPIVVPLDYPSAAEAIAMAERLDPEDLRDLLRDYRQICAKVVEEYNGFVARYIGEPSSAKAMPGPIDAPEAETDEKKKPLWKRFGF